MFFIIIAVTEFGNYIEDNPSNYSCPDHCGVDHNHINIKKQGRENNEYTKIDSGLFVWESRNEGEHD